MNSARPAGLMMDDGGRTSRRQMPAPTDRTAPSRVGLRAATLAAAAMCLFGALTGLLRTRNSGPISEYFLVVQDMPALLAGGLCLLVLALTFGSQRARAAAAWIERCRQPHVVALVAGIALAVIVAGGFAGLNFPLSMDEFWADFDATVLAQGQLLAAVEPAWRAYVPALQPIFRLDVPEHAYWTSNYLPMNAAIRSLFVATLGQPAIAGAALAGIAMLALAGVARRLWPDRPDAAVVGVVLLATSPQFLVTAMTPYAMTAHLALNMVWLWLFLRDSRLSHALAIVVAVVACGLHQVVFHPLFAAPFILGLWFSRRWKLAACYTLAYGVIGIGWILYWSLLLKAVSPHIGQSADVGVSFLLQRVLEFFNVSLTGISLMGLNLYRFFAWQNLFAVPLAIVGVFLCRDWRNPVAQLAAGIALTLAFVTVLMPFQGHGWGYRYLHGHLGAVALLAAFGWIHLTGRASGTRENPALALVCATLVSAFLLVPWQVYQARAFVTPYASAVEAIRNTRADVVMVDPTGTWYGLDLVRNDPFLRNSPKVMSLPTLDEAQIRELCRNYDVAIFDRVDAARFGIWTERHNAVPAVPQTNRDLLGSLGCGRRTAY